MIELAMAYAAIQLIIESLPISSTGHVQLFQFFLTHHGYDTTEGLSEALDHGLHGPTLLILAIYFRSQWWSLLTKTCTAIVALMRAKFAMSALKFSQQKLLHIIIRIMGMVLVADGITSLGYFLLRDRLHALTSGNVLILASGFVGTMGLLWSSRWVENRVSRMLSYPVAILLGVVQGSIALLPGISRFACTVMCARWCGVSARRSLQFSFLMFAPLIIAAFVVKGIPALLSVITVPWLVALGGATLLAYPLFVGACWLALTDRWWWLSYYLIVPITACILLFH